MLRTLCVTLVALSIISRLGGQDLHHTDYRLNPLLLNPAHTGGFYGSIRVGGVYRDQFRSFINEAWQSPAFYVDAPIIRGFKANDWIGVGLLAFTDRVGIADLSTSGGYFSAAYHLGLDKKNNRVFTLGFQYGQIRRNFNDADQLVFASELLNSPVGSSGSDYADQYDITYSDLNVGAKFVNKISKKAVLTLGGTMAHLFPPREVEQFLSTRLTLHGSYRYQYTKKVAFEPVLYFNSIKSSTAVSAQWLTHYLLDKKEGTVLKGGLGYRSLDAAQVLLGAVYKQWEFGLAFDLTISSAARPTRGFGAFEIGVHRIFNIYKKPDLPPTILCPTL